MKILLVEDDSDTVESIKLCLEVKEPEIEFDFHRQGIGCFAKIKK